MKFRNERIMRLRRLRPTVYVDPSALDDPTRCPSCGYTTMEERVRVSRPGQPDVLRVIRRCRISAWELSRFCPPVVVSEEELP